MPTFETIGWPMWIFFFKINIITILIFATKKGTRDFNFFVFVDHSDFAHLPFLFVCDVLG